MNIRYKKAKIGDVPFILKILSSVSGNTENIDSEQFLIAQYGNKIVGCVRIKDKNDYFELASLAVLPDYRRKGIGSALVASIISKNTNKRPLYLFCHTRNEGFYKKFRFRVMEIENAPDFLKRDYNNLLNLKFGRSSKLLLAMVLF